MMRTRGELGEMQDSGIRAVFGLRPILMGAANSAGAVMGTMTDAQSIVVASTALVRQDGKRRSSKPCSCNRIALACLVGLIRTGLCLRVLRARSMTARQ